jgi:purine-nucleoside phosphorylase
MTASLDRFRAAAADLRATVALVLGSGLGSVPRAWRPAAEVAFADVPGLVGTSVAGHSGKIVVGEWAGRGVAVFHGRLHFYEGHPWDRVAGPVRFMADLGVRTLVLTNAAGGIHAELHPGSLMAIRDHLTLLDRDDWRAIARGERPKSPYSPRLLDALLAAAAELGTPLVAGTYAALTGPCYETPAEIRALKACGADAVGMSTAHEARTARALGMEVAGVSCVTNRAAGLPGAVLDHKDVLRTAAEQAERMSALLEGMVRRT